MKKIKTLLIVSAIGSIGWLSGCAALDTTYDILTMFDREEEPSRGTVIMDDGTTFEIQDLL